MALDLDALDAGMLPDRAYKTIGEVPEPTRTRRGNGSGLVTRGTTNVTTLDDRRMLDQRPRAGRLAWGLIADLRKLDADAARAAKEWFDRNEDTITVGQCSEWINRLRAKIASYNGQPAVTITTPGQPPRTERVGGELRAVLAELHEPIEAHPDRGMILRRFALRFEDTTGNEVRFYKLRESKRGRRYLVQMLSDEERMLDFDVALTVARRIAADPMASMLLYGVEIGACGHCGRTLTNDESRALGIGPKCRKGFGI